MVGSCLTDYRYFYMDFKRIGVNNNNTPYVAERLYREANPESKMDVPSYVYELVETWRCEWVASNSVLSLYEWVKQFKEIK